MFEGGGTPQLFVKSSANNGRPAVRFETRGSDGGPAGGKRRREEGGSVAAAAGRGRSQAGGVTPLATDAG